MLNALKTERVMDNSHHLVLSDVPFAAGEKLLIFITTETALQNKLAKWQALFKETQSLLQLQNITDEDIETEIEAYRTGYCAFNQELIKKPKFPTTD
jgi:hypothetical protein